MYKNICELRQIIKKKCKLCGATYKGLKTAKYCSNACKCKVYRQNKSNLIGGIK